MSYHFLMDLALILLSTKLLGLFTQRFQMPQVVGALLAGLLLGPAGLNILAETGFLSQHSRAEGQRKSWFFSGTLRCYGSSGHGDGPGLGCCKSRNGI